MDMQVAALDILTTKGGFAPTAARAIGEAMDLQIARSYDDLATNQRLDETRVLLESKIDGFRTGLESKIDGLRTELEAKIDGLRTELEAKIDGLRTELEAKIDGLRTELEAKIDRVHAELKADMSALESKLVRWMFAALAGQTLVLASLLRLFMPHSS
jgi:F0F1-type ATP synthase membrane subunit b/b'